MIYLPNACYSSELRVIPRNWKTLKKITTDWYIYYRFYDPVSKEKGLYPKGKLVKVRGMNNYHTVADRRKATTNILNDELEKLKAGYNPIGRDIAPDSNDGFIDASTPFVQALQLVEQGFTAARSTKTMLGVELDELYTHTSGSHCKVSHELLIGIGRMADQ
jgi:hypothetical protein